MRIERRHAFFPAPDTEEGNVQRKKRSHREMSPPNDASSIIPERPGKKARTDDAETYREENERLTARVEKLEAENARLRREKDERNDAMDIDPSAPTPTTL